MTKGPSLDPGDKRLAVEVEDHPLAYGDFEGTIPKWQYGGGTVQLWDRGYWEPEGKLAPQKQLEKGDLKFTLAGKRLQGSFVLVRMKHDRDGGKRTNWLLIKHRDAHAVDTDGDAVLKADASVASGRTMAAIAEGRGRSPKPFLLAEQAVDADAVWDSKEGLAAEERGNKPVPRRTATRASKASRPPPADLPDFIPPQLCQSVERPPASSGWLHEIKFDGCRIQARVAGGKVTLKTRKGLDWTVNGGRIPGHRGGVKAGQRRWVADMARAPIGALAISRCRDCSGDDLAGFGIGIVGGAWFCSAAAVARRRPTDCLRR